MAGTLSSLVLPPRFQGVAFATITVRPLLGHRG